MNTDEISRRVVTIAFACIAAIAAGAQSPAVAALPDTATAALTGPPPPRPVAHGNRPVLTAGRATSAIRLDGRLDEGDWLRAAAFDRFVQLLPLEGEPVSEATEARILYDDEALYVGVRLHDGGVISSRLGPRDMPVAGDSDWFAVRLDSAHDHRTAFGFEVNPSGVRRDGVRTVHQDDVSWNPVWEVATSVDAEGWTAEFRIPFSQLRFGHDGAAGWGIQLERIIARKGEHAVSTLIPAAESGGVPAYGHMEGLEGVRRAERVEVIPYGLGRAAEGAPGATLGMDIQYRAAPGLMLNAALNPDFGQVEVDPAVVNLSGFETFYPERRPFFVEGAHFFNFAPGAIGPAASSRNLFYSRRLGRRPQLRAPAGATGVPETTSILAATKLSGKAAGGWTLGLLDVATQEERTYLPGGAEGAARPVVEPLTNHFVGRASREARAGRSAVGGIVTAVHRRLEPGGGAESLRESAYTGGFDARHEWGAGSWNLAGFLAGSHVAGSAPAILATQRAPVHNFQRPDARSVSLDSTRTSLSGFAGQLQLQKQGGRHWRGEAGLFATSPGYEVNDLGFQLRTDMLGGNAQVAFVQSAPGRIFRGYRLAVGSALVGNFDGDHTGNGVSFRAAGQLHSLWSTSFYVGQSFRAMDDRLTRGGPLGATPATTRANLTVTSDTRRRMTTEMVAWVGEDAAGGRDRSLQVGLGYRPSSRLSARFAPKVQQARSAGQFLAAVPDPLATSTFGRRYVFAPLELTSVDVETRVDVTFAPGLTLELFARPVFASIELGDPAELSAPRTYLFHRYGVDRGSLSKQGSTYTVDPDGEGPAAAFRLPDGDFTLRSLRGNALLRWEWRSGSTVYLAWQQTREEQAAGAKGLEIGREARALMARAPRNVLILKATYWLRL
jgi:hypothetical protein